MALKRVDEFDGKTDAEVVEFSINGTFWEIDLSPASLQQMIRDLERYTSAGRRVATRGAKKSAKRHVVNSAVHKPAAEQTAELDAIRSWGRQKGMKISDRGRIPKDVVTAFNEAHAPNSIDPAFSGA